jgi:hypothetical protein
VHLNGRVYAPLVARMMSADPIVDDPMNGQTWNRYSYVGNNPLTFTDPSGYCFLGCGTMGNLGRMQLGTLFRQNPMLGSIVEIAATGTCGLLIEGGCQPQVVAVLASTIIAGITSGRLGKDVLRAGIVTTATVSAFYVVGGLTNEVAGQAFDATHIQPAFGTDAYDFNVVAHAAVGCGASVASGGKCGPGALAGGVTAAAGPVINGNGFASLVANAALGGAAAVLGGGKFENGAVTGAFGYLFSPHAGEGGAGEGGAGEGGIEGAYASVDDNSGGLIRIVPSEGSYAAPPEFAKQFRGSPEEAQVYQTIGGVVSGTLLPRETLSASQLQLPGVSSTVYDVYALGPADDPEPGRIANDPRTPYFYFSPYHYLPAPGPLYLGTLSVPLPNVWIRLQYGVMGTP